MKLAFSRLGRILKARKMTVADLQERLERAGMRSHRKQLARLQEENEPLGRLDLRLAATICEVCRVPLSNLIVFRNPLRTFSRAKQKRLDELMSANSQGILTESERGELESLVGEAQAMTLHNARVLAGYAKPVLTP